MEKKICTKCNLEKGFSEFGKMKNGKFGLRAICNECHRESNKQYYVENKDKVSERNTAWQKDVKNKETIRFYQIKRVYGISKTEWLEMLNVQNNSCKICNSSSEDLGFFHTDHDHNTGKVRGLLCKNCNTVLGHAKDDIKILEEAIKYLKNNE